MRTKSICSLIFVLSLFLVANPGIAGTGGPDEFGYIWIDSDEPGGPTYNWVDITGRGTQMFLGDDDNQAFAMTPFSFEFYGNDFDSFHVCSNGWGSFTSTNTSLGNRQLPDPDPYVPYDLMSIFWDDLNPTQGGEVWYFVGTDSVIVSCIDVPHYYNTGANTFQIILTSDDAVHFQYAHVDSPVNECTVGIQNGDGTIGLTVVYDDVYLHDSLAIDFKLPPVMMMCTNYSEVMCRGRNRFEFSLEFMNRTGEAIPLTLYWGAHEGFGCVEEPFKLLRREQTIPAGPSMRYFYVKVHKSVLPGDYSASVSFLYNQELIACCMNTTIIECGPFRGSDANNWEWGELERGEIGLPVATALHQNYPNPFNANTNISYSLVEASNVSLKVYDITGRQVATLVNGHQEAGEHVVSWDASNVSSGVYFYKLTAGDYTATKSMNLLK